MNVLADIHRLPSGAWYVQGAPHTFKTRQAAIEWIVWHHA